VRGLRAGAGLCLLAALTLPALALFPPCMHGFVLPKSAAWEPLVVLAAALAWALPRTREGASRAWFAVWGLWALAALGWLGVRAFSAAPPSAPGDIQRLWLFRGTEALAALCLAERAWRSGALSGSALAPLPRLAFSLAACWFLSAALSARPDAAFPQLLDWAGYLLVFAAVWSLAADRAGQGRVLAALLFAGALNAVYGLVQTLGLDPVRWAETFDGRASGFFGNPDFLGGHLALLLPPALALALGPGLGAWARALSWALVGLFGAALLATQTRGAWAGALAGCAVLFWGLRRVDPALFVRRRAALLAGLLALVCGLGAWWGLGGAARLGAAFSGDQEAGERLFLMEKTAQLAWSHPLLGVGPGCFRVDFPSVEALGSGADLGRPYVLSEHGHNDFLQMAADAGWPAALLWLALSVLLCARLASGLGAAPRGAGFLAAGVLGAWAALLVHGLANFPFQIVPTQSAAWALAALGLRALNPAPAPGTEAGVFSRAWLALGLALAGLLVAARGRQLFEDALWWRGSGELALKNEAGALPLLRKAGALDPDEDRLWALQGQAQLDQGQWDAGIGCLRRAQSLNPYDALCALRLGQALMEQRRYDEARTVLGRAVAYAPNFADLWEPLAAADFEEGKFDAAISAYDRMLAFQVDQENAYTNKAAALGELGRLPEARRTLVEAERRFPGSGELRINLAITLYKMGLRKEAALALDEAAVLSPGDPQVDSLRKAMRR
jgi:tetratricopeptide (TPR) repeat protein